MRREIVRTAGLSAALAAAFVLAVEVITPLTASVLPLLAVGAIIPFPPHGVRVIAAWMYGWRSAMYLLPGNAVVFAVYAPLLDLQTLAILFVTHTISPPLAFAALAHAGIDLRNDPVLRFNWRSLLVVGALSSLMNAAVLHVLQFEALPSVEHLAGVAMLVLGDVLGVVCVLLVLIAVDRTLRAR